MKVEGRLHADLKKLKFKWQYPMLDLHLYPSPLNSWPCRANFSVVDGDLRRGALQDKEWRGAPDV